MVVSVAVNYASRYGVEALYSDGAAVTKVDNISSWQIDTSHLPNGNYYVSSARTAAPCDLKFDGNIVATTRSPLGSVLSATTLGSSFVKRSNGPSTIAISCSMPSGFVSGLTERPVVMTYTAGRLFHIYRTFVSVWLGLISNFVLIIALVILQTVRTKAKASSPLSLRNWRGKIPLATPSPFIVLGCAAVLYSVSLSYTTWMIFPAQYATAIHVFVRLSMSFAFLNLGYSFAEGKRRFGIGYLILFFIYIGFYFGSGLQVDSLVYIYKRTHVLFGLSTFILWYDLQHNQLKNRSFSLLSQLTLLWAVGQCCDSVMFLYPTPFYSGPIILAAVAFITVMVKRTDVYLTYQAERMSGSIVECASTNGIAIDSLIQQTCLIIGRETHFERQSVYVDAFCLGRTARPHSRLLRVFEYGYKKDTDLDTEISLGEGRGEIMVEAMRSGQVIFRKGKDNAWYCVIPCGSLACINLSDSSFESERIATTSLSIVQKLKPVIGLLGQKLVAANLQRNIFLQRVKAIRGFGNWPIEYGTIRVDVDDFSRNTTKYQMMNNGQDVYGEFINSVYLPSLLKHIAGFAELEEQIGDELYLVVLDGLAVNTQSVAERTCQAIHRLTDFIKSEGAALCRDHGFVAVSLTGAASFGQGMIFCDEFKVRTSGLPANIVKRLQDSAEKGSLFIDDRLVSKLSAGTYSLGRLREKQVKKDLVKARSLYYGRHSTDVASWD